MGVNDVQDLEYAFDTLGNLTERTTETWANGLNTATYSETFSYVLNNPLSYTDPSGFFFKKLFKGIGKLFKGVARVIGRIVRGVNRIINKITGGNPFLNLVIAGVAAWYTRGLAFDSYIAASTNVAVHSAAVAGGVTTVSVAQAAVTTAQIIGGAVGGAVAGAMLGGDLQSTLAGAVTGAAFAGSGAFFGNKWTVARVLTDTTIGGVSAELQGGRFERGALFAGVAASARYLYNRAVNYDIDLREGGAAVGKDPTTPPQQFVNNIGIANRVVNPSSFFGEGGRLSRLLNRIPGVNAVAGLHDVFQVELEKAVGAYGRSLFNVPGMPIAAGVTSVGTLTGLSAVELALLEERRRRDALSGETWPLLPAGYARELTVDRIR